MLERRGAGSSSSASSATSKFETIKPGTLTIVTSSDLTPFAYIKDKKWVGVDVALVSEAAKNIGLKVEITAHDFDTLIPLVASGQADLTMGSIADTDVRRKTVDFTLPDIIGNNALVVPKDSKIKTEDDVARQEDRHSAVQPGAAVRTEVLDEVEHRHLPVQ